MTKLSHWTDAELQRFLEIRQEFFLDPMGSNKNRFLEAVTTVQRALFDWYLLPPGKFEGAMALVKEAMGAWSELRKEERRTLRLRRFALNNAAPDIPAVESSVSENQWQKIFGSLGLGLNEPGTFDRFLVQLDEETNPSLRMNHRFMGELGPHDNMISYVSSIVATFLNENAIIGKVSPCVTHMEQAVIRWLLTLVGWDSAVSVAEQETHVPAPRLPTPTLPAERFLRWEREEPTGTIVVGGTIANISALLIARNAVFDYLLGWPGAVQWLGPMLAWELVRSIWSKDRLVVLTSKGAHYSVKKAALQAGVAPGNIFDIAGSRNPWILDGEALKRNLADVEDSALVIAVVAIAGKTETGYVDEIEEIANVLNKAAATKAKTALPSLEEVGERLRSKVQEIKDAINQKLHSKSAALDSFKAARKAWKNGDDMKQLIDRIESGNEIAGACHNRLFLHVDAAHGGAYLTVPELRQAFRGIELADTITIDGHKSFYCYYPCGGLLVRTTRWAQTLSAGQTAYISEDDNRGVYREGLLFAHAMESGQELSVGSHFDGNSDYLEHPATKMDERDLAKLAAIYQMTRRPVVSDRSELTHQPFNQYLEGSRGAQGIMQWYFNLATLGLRGYQSILGWTALLRARAEEAISLGMSDTRLVTDPPLPIDLYAVDKQAAIQSAGTSGVSFEEMRPPEEELRRAALPLTGGRFLRLSAGHCNQLLMTYVPAREAKLIATASRAYWENRGDVVRLMRYLWRVNQHLWTEHIYANPHFTYYLGHTALPLELPSVGEGESAAGRLAEILTEWNAWARNKGKDDQSASNPFFKVLAERIEKGARRGPKKQEKGKLYAWKFFCHKLIVMHPYTDESLIGDMLRRVAFYGERSVIDVRVADATARFLFPDNPTE
ncbi:MAG TPA: pyridoxal-dependent decarboxylase [Thermoanaerobaculia bacterium]|nr:pyridoxal-dependent decarboxylase [Thermoanaerobaculia bacterium]